MIPESIIEESIDYLGEERSTLFEEVLRQLEQEQPDLLEWMFADSLRFFTVAERDFVLYLLLVIWHAIKKVHPTIPSLTKSQLLEAEDQNWELLQPVTAHRFKERLDVFFDTSEEEDLLAFIEDALIEDEDSFIPKEGREPIFVMLKSAMDCMLPAID